MTLYVDPATQAFLDRARAQPAVDYRTMPPAEGRALFETLQRPLNFSPYAMAEIRDLAVPGPAGPIPARLFRPTAEPASPVVLYAHGGGWTFGSIESHHALMQNLAGASGCAVLGLDYRLAPEHPFPAPLDDVLAGLDFIAQGGLGVHADASRVAVAGDSAGANLALGAMVARKAAGRPLPRTAALFYGCFAPIFDTPSHLRCGDGSYLLGTAGMRWYWANYLGEAAAAPPPAAAPLDADLAGLPPLYLNCAGLDPLTDDTLILAQRLAEAGVRYRLDSWPGVLHGFMRMVRDVPAALAATRAAGAFLREEFARG
ncbi:alpha/beta hydrolase [Alsobacter sp. SYSU BS001988]